MDNLFKALLIIILVAFLYLYYENSDNDRYFLFQSNLVFDKKTATSYYRGGSGTGVKVLDYINGIEREYPWRYIKDDK